MEQGIEPSANEPVIFEGSNSTYGEQLYEIFDGSMPNREESHRIGLALNDPYPFGREISPLDADIGDPYRSAQQDRMRAAFEDLKQILSEDDHFDIEGIIDEARDTPVFQLPPLREAPIQKYEAAVVEEISD